MADASAKNRKTGSKAIYSIRDLKLEYYIWGENPIQGFGEIHDREFHFLGKDDGWKIEVAGRGEARPSEGGKYGFVRGGNRSEAGPMTHKEAAKIIDNILHEYVSIND